MQKNKTNTWLFWTILILVLAALGACSKGGPTTPNPSDVQDFTYDEGGGFEGLGIDDLLTAYSALKDAGGGAATIVDDTDYTLIGAFERWSGDALDDVFVTVQESDGTVVRHTFNGMAAWANLEYPITVSVMSMGRVAQTVVETDANVIAFGLDWVTGQNMFSMVFGYTMEFGGDFGDNWLIQAKTTHINRPWQTTYGGPFASPYTQLFANPNQPVGAVAFFYANESGIEPGVIFVPGVPSSYDLIGYSYSHIGSLDPGAVGGWIMDMTEEGSGTEYGPGNYDVSNLQWDPDKPIGRVTITPGGCLDESCEFIPYYPAQTALVTDPSGEYSVTSFDPSVITDRDILYVNFDCWNWANVKEYIDWEVGTDLPDLNPGVPPECGMAVCTYGDDAALTADWTNAAAEGLLLISIEGKSGNVIWEITVANDALALPDDGIIIPVQAMLNLGLFQPSIVVTRIECPVVTVDAYDAQTIWADTTARLTSPHGLVLGDLSAGDEGGGPPPPTP